MLAVTTAFSVLSCISFVLVPLSFPWYLKSPCSTGVYLYMAWTSLGCLNLFINSIMWRDSMSNLAPIWCDVSTKFMTIVGVALPVAAMCICRHLCAPRSKKVERRRIILDLSIGLGVPAVYVLLHIVVQRFRFDIFEGYGCVPSVYNTPLAYVIVQAPILAFALVSAIYCFASLVRFRRISAEDLSTNACLSPYWYFRLLCLAATEVVLCVAGGIMRIVLSSRGQVIPWVSWGDMHEVVEFSAEVWRADMARLLSLEEARWTMVARAGVFFALFASRRAYRMNSDDRTMTALSATSTNSPLWKDLPPEPEQDDSPPSAATSESMYSTSTEPSERTDQGLASHDPVHRGDGS